MGAQSPEYISREEAIQRLIGCLMSASNDELCQALEMFDECSRIRRWEIGDDPYSDDDEDLFDEE